MNHAQALQRLAGCRELQKDAMQVVVSADVVDALLHSYPCPSCVRGSVIDSNGARWRCATCRGTGRLLGPGPDDEEPEAAT